MITTSQKQFILDTLLPYLQNPNTCGFDNSSLGCLYLTPDGRKCAVGKHMKEGSWQYAIVGYSSLIKEYNKEEFFTKEALEQNLSDDIWVGIQGVHDCIANSCTGKYWVEHYQIHLDKLERLTGVEFPELKK